MFFFGGGGKLTSHQMGPISMAPSQPPLTVPSLDFDTQNAPRFQPENEFLRSVCSIFTADTRKILLFNSLFVSKMLPKKKSIISKNPTPKILYFWNRWKMTDIVNLAYLLPSVQFVQGDLQLL